MNRFQFAMFSSITTMITISRYWSNKTIYEAACAKRRVLTHKWHLYPFLVHQEFGCHPWHGLPLSLPRGCWQRLRPPRPRRGCAWRGSCEQQLQLQSGGPLRAGTKKSSVKKVAQAQVLYKFINVCTWSSPPRGSPYIDTGGMSIADGQPLELSYWKQNWQFCIVGHQFHS